MRADRETDRGRSGRGRHPRQLRGRAAGQCLMDGERRDTVVHPPADVYVKTYTMPHSRCALFFKTLCIYILS